MSTDRPVRPPEPLLAPAVEARIREIVREMLPEIVQAVLMATDEALALSLANLRTPEEQAAIARAIAMIEAFPDATPLRVRSPAVEIKPLPKPNNGDIQDGQ